EFDGVFGIWYGKGPGVDRCSDVFKHANMAGTAKHGGVIAIAGDDHIAKSSTAAHQSDHIFKACGLPVFFPSSVQDILDMGLHAFALSRFAGVWSGMKTIQEIVESASSVFVDPDRVDIVLPEDFQMPPGGLHIRWPDPPLEQESRLFDYKWYAALAYIRANRLNHDVIRGPNDRFGIIASGKAYNDTRQALVDLGLDDDTCRRVGADTASRIDARVAIIEAKERALAAAKTDSGDRTPWFCSGCPHNTSTKVPEGSRAVAGIGCHYMAVWMDRSTSTFTQMGGEGVSWMGQAPFTTDRHIFANLGDGTYFHSGLLAVRQSIAA